MKSGQVKKRRGFTLIELLITIVVIAILASIAAPSFIDYLRKARRADAMTALQDIQLAQEKWRRNDVDYGTTAEIKTIMDYTTSPWLSSDRHYTLSITANSATAFSATAAPVTGGAQDGDSCGTFAIDQDGANTTGTYANNDCWRQ